MSTNWKDLDPDTPEYEAALESAQAEEDAANGNLEQRLTVEAEATGEQPAAEVAASAAAPTAETAGEAQAAVTPEPEKPGKPTGVLSKDGRTVLSYAVVQSARSERNAERHARQAAEAERDALREQVEALKSGNALPDPDADPLDAEIAELAQDIPAIARMHESNKDLRRRVDALTARPAAAAEATADPHEALQEDIDSVPLLAEWQAGDREKFKRAQELDAAYINSPKWRDKSQADRFAFVARQVAHEYDIQTDPQPNNPPSRPDPRTVIAAAARTAPNTLSDFKGGSADTSGGQISDSMSVRQMHARFAGMTDAQIDAQLSRLG